jgi:predicted anti-sigma-YlaC factor YlaD
VNHGPIIPGGITCREVVELVTAYLDRALDPEIVQRMDEHLKLCPPCDEYVEQVRATARLTAAVATAEHELRPDRDALLIAFRGFNLRG